MHVFNHTNAVMHEVHEGLGPSLAGMQVYTYGHSVKLYCAAIIATDQAREASLTLDKLLQLSRSNVNSVARSYLSPTPVGVGVEQVFRLTASPSLRESGYARLVHRRYSGHLRYRYA